MSNICITGIGGYLGLATAYTLKAAGHTVVGTGSSRVRPDMLPEGVVYASIDIRDTPALAAFLIEHAVETVYHFAAIKYVGKCEADPTLCHEINTNGTVCVLQAMAMAQVPHIVYASTYAVYDWTGDQVVLTETTPTKPATVYGRSKLNSELTIKDAYEAGTITRYQILRYGNIIGAIPELPTHRAQSFVDKIMLATKTGETVTLNGDSFKTIDGTVARDFIDIRDVAQVHVLLAQHPYVGIMNVASGIATTLRQLIAVSEHLSGTSLVVVIQPPSGNEPSSITIDRSILVRELEYKPAFALTDTLESLLQKLTT